MVKSCYNCKFQYLNCDNCKRCRGVNLAFYWQTETIFSFIRKAIYEIRLLIKITIRRVVSNGK